MSLEKIYQLKADESEQLYCAKYNDETIEVRQWQNYRWLHLNDKSVQSLMQTDAIDQVLLPNIQALLSVLLFCPSPVQILNLGLGGASLERYLDLNWPDVTLRSVESNKHVLELAKNYFYLPEKVDVIIDTAAEFFINHDDSYDIILCDIFVADMQASCLYSNDFYANISNCISSEGVMAINILPESEEDVVNVLLPIKNHFNFLYLLEFPDYSNAIIFASKKRVPDRDELHKRAEELLKATKLDLTDIPNRLNVLLETV